MFEVIGWLFVMAVIVWFLSQLGNSGPGDQG